LLLLEPQLRRVINVLILAAAALAKVTARRLDALRRRFFDLQQLCPRKMLFDLDNLDFGNFTHEHERDKYDKIVHAANALAAKRDVADGQTQPVADLKSHKGRLKGVKQKKSFFRRSYFSFSAAMAAFICSK